MLIFGKDYLECASFRLKGGYGKTIARMFSLPVAVESTEPLTLEIVLKNEFYPKRIKRRVYWNRKFIGFFLIASAEKEWNGDSYRTRLELKQCDRDDKPDEAVPLYKWRHDLLALSQGLPETEGAALAAGRTVDPFANSWKVGSETVDNDADDRPEAPPLPIAQGGTGERDSKLALLRLGGIPSDSKGVAFGVAPLGADGKVPSQYLPPLGGGGGSTVIYPIAVNLGGTGADNATLARQNIGAIALSDLPPYPTLASLNAVSTASFTTAINSLIPLSAIGVASGVAPLGTDSKVPATYLPAYPTLGSLGGIPSSAIGSTIAPLDTNLRVPATFLPAYPTLTSLGALAASAVGNSVAPLTGGLVPAVHLPTYPTLTSLGGVPATGNTTIEGNKTFTGFTTLGDSPIKIKVVQGMTNVTQGQQVSIAHGVNSSKITSVSGSIFYTATAFPIPNDMPSVPIAGRQAGFASSYNINASAINVSNEAANSGSIVNRPFYLEIHYTS